MEQIFEHDGEQVEAVDSGAAQVGEASAAPEQPSATPDAELVASQPAAETPQAAAVPATLEEKLEAAEKRMAALVAGLEKKLHDAGIRLLDGEPDDSAVEP